MNLAWKQFLDQQGAHFDADVVCDCGSALAEIDATEHENVLVPLTGYGLLRATGEDAAGFLNNLLTNEVTGLPLATAQHNSLCSAKGRMLANFTIWRDGSDYLLQLAADVHAAVLKKLSMYVLRSKVKLSDAREDYVLLGVAGSGAAAAVKELAGGLPAAPLGAARFDAGSIMRRGAQRFELVLRPDAAPDAWARLSAAARPSGFPAWQWLEIRDGLPLITAATQEQFVPQMVNFELIGGISFKKGCYPGQEIVARTQYLGKLKRRMYLAHVDAGAPRAGIELFSSELPGQSCGMVVNVAPAPAGGCDLLAVIQMSSAESGDIHLAAPDGPRLALQALPYTVS